MKKIYCLMQHVSPFPYYSWLLAIAVIINGCKKEEMLTRVNPTASDLSNAKADIIVHAGESIQAAVDAAQSGWLIKIEPGTYMESIIVNKPGIKLMGIDEGAGVIIQNPGDEENGIFVGDAGDGFVLQHVTVKGFEENGVFLDSVDNFTISHVTAIDNKEYGIFPVHSSHGVVDHCMASGSSDTGIYIGQSSDVSAQYNTVTANVNGLEVENCSDVSVTNNQSYDNVCGILVDLLPQKDVKTSNNVYVGRNHVYNNNHVNFGEEGSLESFVPSGLGILVIGTDQTTVENNVVKDNQFSGITVFSSLVLVVLGAITIDEIDVEPYPDQVHIANNIAMGNGTNALPALAIPGVDLLWDGSGTGNCWSNNKFGTSSPSPLPMCN